MAGYRAPQPSPLHLEHLCFQAAVFAYADVRCIDDVIDDASFFRPNGVGGNKPALSTNYVEQGTGYNPKPVPETAAAAEAVALAAELRAPAAAAGVAAAAVPDLTTSPTPAPIVSVVAESAALPAARKCCQGSCSQCA